MAVEDVVVRGFNSENSVRAKAYLKAQKLSNLSYVPQLFDYLNNEKDKTNRDSAYYILGHLLKRTTDNVQIQKFVDYLKTENNSDIIAGILDRLSEIILNEPIEIKPILDLVENSKWRIRHSAIMALTYANQEIVKDKLRNIIRDFQVKKDKLDVVYATSVICQIGDTSDIPMLQELLSSKVKDIRDSAKSAIRFIQQT